MRELLNLGYRNHQYKRLMDSSLSLLGASQAHDRHRKKGGGLEVVGEDCGTAFECAPNWKIDKKIKTCKKKVKRAKTCVFKGDTVKVNYDIDVDREPSGQICFTWPVKIHNTSCNPTNNLKIGVKAYLVDNDKHGSSKHKNKNQSKTHDEDKVFVGRFCDFENQKPCLGAGECHTYALTACFKPKCNIRSKLIYLTTDDLISSNGCVANSVCVTFEISSGSSATHGCHEIVVADKQLGFHETIDCPKTLHVSALLTPGENIECNEVFCNTSTLHQVSTKKCENSDKCDHDECKSGKRISGDCVESSAAIRVDCAKVKLECTFSNTNCAEDWCLCQSSNACGDKISYKINVKKDESRKGLGCFGARVCLEGCDPKYKKEYTLSLIKCDADGKDDGKVITQVCFKLGKGKRSFSFPTKQNKRDCKDESSDDRLNVSLDKNDSGNFIFVLTSEKQRYDFSTNKAQVEPECEKNKQISKHSCCKELEC